MNEIIEPLVLDLVRWCAGAPRSYDEVLAAWRTSCPRLMVWEEAMSRGLLETRPGPNGLEVVVTAGAYAYLAAAGAPVQAGPPSAPPIARAREPA